MPVVETKFTLFEMLIELVLMDAAKARETDLTQAPKVLNPVNMIMPLSKDILTVTNPIMSFVSVVSQSVVSPQAIAVKGGALIGLPVNNRQNLIGRTVFDDLSIDFAIPFQHSKDRDFSCGSPPALTSHSLCAKVAFIKLNFTLTQRNWCAHTLQLSAPEWHQRVY